MTTVAASLAPDLAAAIERLYEVFAPYPLLEPGPCDDCYPADEVARIRARLTTVPLRELTIDDIGHFSTDGTFTWGGVTDLKHLLPRLLELGCRWWILGETATDGDRLDAELDLSESLVLGLLDRGDPEGWPTAERDAVAVFLDALWPASLARDGDEPLPYGSWVGEGLLIAILARARDVDGCLERFLAGPLAARHLAWLLMDLRDGSESPALRLRDVRTWDPARRATIDGWLRAHAADALLAAIRDPASRTYRWELVLGLEFLQAPAEVRFVWGHWEPTRAARARALELGVDLGREMPARPEGWIDGVS